MQPLLILYQIYFMVKEKPCLAVATINELLFNDN